MLAGRELESASIVGLLDAARAGRSSVLVLRGESGIGKTALLELAMERAEGFRVLRVRGVQSESEIAFSGLQELVGPVTGLLAGLPPRQRRVLEGALALGPPVSGDPLAVRAATLSVLVAAGAAQPLLVVVDDAQWLDRPSAEALAFAARRVGDDAIVVLIAVSEGVSSAFDSAGLAELTLEGLREEAALAVMKDRIPGAISAAVARQLLTLAEGNPLALQELPAGLSAVELAGREPLREPVPVGTGLERTLARRLTDLTPDGRSALLVLAAGAREDLKTVRKAIEALGVSADALDEAERKGLVKIVEGQVGFRHPLLRSVVYQHGTARERREAHSALALSANGATDRSAWHLAAAATGPDETVASALEDAAQHAAERGGFDTAARALERAAALTGESGVRARRLLAAANHAHVAGKPAWASALAVEGLSGADSMTVRADLLHIVGVSERMQGSGRRARAMLWDAAAEVCDEDPSRAVAMLLDAWFSDQSRDLRKAEVTAERAQALARGASSALQQLAAAAKRTTAAFRGALPAREVEEHAVAAALAASFELPPASAEIVAVLSVGADETSGDPTGMGGKSALEGRIAKARDDGELSILPWLLMAGADVCLRGGSWNRAVVHLGDAIELAEVTGQRSVRAFALCGLARIEAARGLEVECREHTAEACRLAEALDAELVEVVVASVLGLMELGVGNITAAVRHLLRCADRADRYGLECPPVVPYEADLVEALGAAARRAEAVVAAERLQQRAERSGSEWALAAAARCRGLLSPTGQFEHEFETALALHQRDPTPFERARTELCLGERLRRARRRADARRPLLSAQEAFALLGAVPWEQRASRELAATGMAVQLSGSGDGVEHLTPQERRIALIVADGATVREAADQLFLSPKTVEAHLGRVYRKLGVHNRAQLARTLASGNQARQM